MTTTVELIEQDGRTKHTSAAKKSPPGNLPPTPPTLTFPANAVADAVQDVHAGKVTEAKAVELEPPPPVLAAAMVVVLREEHPDRRVLSGGGGGPGGLPMRHAELADPLPDQQIVLLCRRAPHLAPQPASGVEQTAESAVVAETGRLAPDQYNT